MEGGNGGSWAYGIAILSFFSSGISVTWILKCGIAVSFTLVVCLMRFSVKEDPSQYCSTVHCALLSNARQYFQDFRLIVNDYHYTISDR